MTLFAIGDLHLPGGEEKPMDIFGDHWENHFAHIAADWRARVKDGDVVLIPGDISWAMQLERAVPQTTKSPISSASCCKALMPSGSTRRSLETLFHQ